jgi:hypothetical protein
MVMLAATPAASAQSKAWQKQSLQEAMAQSHAWQHEKRQQTMQHQLALQQPAIPMPAQEIATPASTALLALQCMATINQPVLVSPHTVALPLPPQPLAEAVLKAIACSMAWLTKLECVPQCSLPEPPLLMPAPAVQPSYMRQMIENSRLWQQKQLQQQPSPSQLPCPSHEENLPQQSAVPGATSQALCVGMSCPALGPETSLQPPTALLFGSLLNERQAQASMMPQTVRPNVANSWHMTAVPAKGDGGCHVMPDVPATAPKEVQDEDPNLNLEQDHQDKEDCMDMHKQCDLVKGDSAAMLDNDKTQEEYHKGKWCAKRQSQWVHNGKAHLPGKRRGSRTMGNKGKHQGPRLHHNIVLVDGKPRWMHASVVPAWTRLCASIRKRDRDAKDQASSGFAQGGANATSKCKHATAGVEGKPITRILPDEMETQPANINETFVYLMEPSLLYPEAEPSSDWLDTATTLEFPGVAGVAMQQHDALQSAPTQFVTLAATPEEPLEASASPTLDPEPYAAVPLIATCSDIGVVAMLSSTPATSGTATLPLAAAAAGEPWVAAAAASAPLAILALPLAASAPTPSDAAVAAAAPDAKGVCYLQPNANRCWDVWCCPCVLLAL